MIAAVVLAAGASTRLGRPKQQVTVGGQGLLRHTVDCCATGGCDPVVVVLGAFAERIRPELDGLDVRIVLNDGWSEGMASSIRAGISALSGEATAALLLPCDQPRLTSDVVRRVLARFDRTPGRIVACEYADTIGTPALFERRRFDELLALHGDRGAKPLLLRHSAQVVRLPWLDGAVDVDLPGDEEGS